MMNRRVAIICLTLVIIVSTVVSQEECYKPPIFMNRATLDRYLRCLKAKLGPRYGKRMVTSVIEKPEAFIPGIPSDSYDDDLSRILQLVDNN